MGGYITFAGAHRMIDSGYTGPESAKEITKTSILGIVITGIMRILLFLAVLGVVATGVTLSEDNTAADAFYQAAGEIGLRFFGIVLFSAGLTSVVGASYTSVTFVTGQNTSQRTRSWLTVAFVVVCTIGYLTLGKGPQELLIFAGAFNGLILPIGFTIVGWVAWRRRDLMHGAAYPKGLLLLGGIAWLFTIYLGVYTFSDIMQLWA